MKLEITGQLEAATKTSGAVKAYRKAPGSFAAACRAALHYATRWQQPAVVVPGNSYMQPVWHIAKTSQNIRRFVPMPGAVRVAVVTPSGQVSEALAS